MDAHQQHYSNMNDKGFSSNRMAHEEASFRKAAADTQYFWNQVKKNAGVRKVIKTKPQNSVREETSLFGSQCHSTEAFEDVIQDSIPVERSGTGSEDVAILEKFCDLKNVPSFITKNIQLMRYETATPIQVIAFLSLHNPIF
jgi:murein L,D-transpeptidase YcbB/YkuD